MTRIQYHLSLVVSSSDTFFFRLSPLCLFCKDIILRAFRKTCISTDAYCVKAAVTEVASNVPFVQHAAKAQASVEALVCVFTARPVDTITTQMPLFKYLLLKIP